MNFIGGAAKLLNKENRTMSVVVGQEARLTWKFLTNETIYFHGIVWTFRDRLLGNDTKLLWMDRYEKLYRHSFTKNRSDYDVRLKSETIGGNVQLTLVIPNTQRIHENEYVCHVIRSDIRDSVIKLKVKRKCFIHVSTFTIPRKL